MQLDEIQLRRAYQRMTLIRVFETRIHEENLTGIIPGFVHLYAGQEAIAVGVCENLTVKDKIASTHRGHGHCIAKGSNVKYMMAEIFGKAAGLCHGKGGSMHLADLERGMLGANGIVGAGAPLALGAALTAKYRGKGNVAVAFLGDGASNIGPVFESLNMAVVLQLPVIFVFENNGFGELTGHDYAVGCKDITARTSAFGMPAVRVDGTDFFDVFEETRLAVERARNGGGPSAIEAVAWRWYGHFEGDPQLYRSKDEIKRQREEKDPLKIFRENDSNPFLPELLDEIDIEVLELVEEAIEFAKTAPVPNAEEVTDNVYVEY